MKAKRVKPQSTENLTEKCDKDAQKSYQLTPTIPYQYQLLISKHPTRLYNLTVMSGTDIIEETTPTGLLHLLNTIRRVISDIYLKEINLK